MRAEYARKVFTWFLVNFILCIAPIIYCGIVQNDYGDDIFQSYIAFIYTLMLCSLYIYYYVDDKSDIVFWSGLLFVVISVFFFCIFPKSLPPSRLSFVQSHKWYFTVGMFCLALVISFLLNKDTLEDLVEKSIQKKKFKQAEETKSRVSKMSDTLKIES